jgi:hypothetical protein
MPHQEEESLLPAGLNVYKYAYVRWVSKLALSVFVLGHLVIFIASGTVGPVLLTFLATGFNRYTDYLVHNQASRPVTQGYLRVDRLDYPVQPIHRLLNT